MDAARPGPATDPGKALFIDGDDDDVVRRQALPEPLAEIEDQVIDWIADHADASTTTLSFEEVMQPGAAA